MRRKNQKLNSSKAFVVGIDEAGRGPLAGPVSVGIVLMTAGAYKKFKRSKEIKSLHNSKALSEKQREEWFKKIKNWQKEGLLDFSYTTSSAQIIDQKGIVPAIKLALNRGLKSLEVPTDAKILMDGGLKSPDKYLNQQAIIKGDELEPIISLASIVAKVKRDKFMESLSKKYPGKYLEYGFEIHKGYGTKKHRDTINKFGLSKVHRKSFCKNSLRQKA